MNNNYDIIGDVHGKADKLRNLLELMEYKKVDGIYQHENRKAIFVGDLIDRGSNNMEVVDIAKSMTEAGNAITIMGNHEYNAICFNTSDGNGRYLRPRTDKNIGQHISFLSEYYSLEDDFKKLDETISWFKSLPIYFETDEFRVVHACWDERSIAVLKGQLNSDNTLTEELIRKSCEKGSAEYKALEVLLKGVEIALPAGASLKNKDGNVRTETRIKWWLQGEQSFKAAALVPEEYLEKLPDAIIPNNKMVNYDRSNPPVFFGHYWMHGVPRFQADNICCLDYSVAKDVGKLCAYRWSGEGSLSTNNFICTSRRNLIQEAMKDSVTKITEVKSLEIKNITFDIRKYEGEFVAVLNEQPFKYTYRFGDACGKIKLVPPLAHFRAFTFSTLEIPKYISQKISESIANYIPPLKPLGRNKETGKMLTMQNSISDRYIDLEKAEVAANLFRQNNFLIKVI